MRSSDDQYQLNPRQRREIDQLSQKLHFNLAPPPSSLDEMAYPGILCDLRWFRQMQQRTASTLAVMGMVKISELSPLTS